MEYKLPSRHSLKILWKSENFPWRYKRKREWVFFSEHSVYPKASVRLSLKEKATSQTDLLIYMLW